MKKIIVPIDFSKHSEYALETASILAKKHDAEILALHMLEISEAVLTKGSNTAQNEAIFFIKLAEKNFNEFLDKDFLNDVNVTPIIKHFKVFKEVSEVAKEHNADLIVMGSHGASGMKEIFVGSNTEKVVRYSETPVLVVKHSPILLNFENVIFASDFSKDSVMPYLNASKMFDLMGAKMSLVHVNTPYEKFRSTKEVKEKVMDFLKAADGNLDNLDKVNYVNDYTVEKGVLNFSEDSNADMIAIATHGRKGLAHFFEGSISEDLANHSNLPVMTFKV